MADSSCLGQGLTSLSNAIIKDANSKQLFKHAEISFWHDHNLTLELSSSKFVAAKGCGDTAEANLLSALDDLESMLFPKAAAKDLQKSSEIVSNSSTQSAIDKKEIEVLPILNAEAKKTDQAAERTHNIQLCRVKALTEHEFTTAPSYMRGRLQLHLANGFIERFNTAVEKKYRIVNASMKSLTKTEKDKKVKYRSQEVASTAGEYFVVQDDFKPELQSRDVIVQKQIFPILRHLGRIKEVRGGNVVRYVIQPC